MADLNQINYVNHDIVHKLNQLRYSKLIQNDYEIKNIEKLLVKYNIESSDIKEIQQYIFKIKDNKSNFIRLFDRVLNFILINAFDDDINYIEQLLNIINEYFIIYNNIRIFIKIIKYYINNYFNLNLPKTINLSYMNKYKLSTIANMIINNDELIEIVDNNCQFNYCGDGKLLNDINIQLDGLEESLKKYDEHFFV